MFHRCSGVTRSTLAAGLVALASVSLIGCATSPMRAGAPAQHDTGRPGEATGMAGKPGSGTGASSEEGSSVRRGNETAPVPPARITASQGAHIDALLTQTRELLLLAPDVARIRWNAKQMPEDAAAEQAIVNAAVAQATQLNSDPELFRAFFKAQLEASKFVQSEMHKQWREARLGNITLMRTPAQVQAASDDITPRLLQALAKAAPALKAIGVRSLIETRAAEIMPTRSALSDPTRAIAIRPLLERAAE
jgi:chorismate mutase